MKTSIFYLLIIIQQFFPSDLMSQNYKINISGGASYNYLLNKNFTDFTNKISDQFQQQGVSLASVNNLPTKIQLGVSVQHIFKNKNSIGVFYNFYNTGSQLNYSDFTGKINLVYDIILNSFGMAIGTYIGTSPKWYLPLFEIRYGITLIDLKQLYKEKYEGNNLSDYQVKNKKEGFVLFSEIAIRWDLNKFIPFVYYEITTKASSSFNSKFDNYSNYEKKPFVNYNENLNFNLNSVTNSIGICIGF